MSAKMTPGPWIANDGWDDDIQILARGKQLALVTNYPQNKIDARAIACLPELVEAARKLTDGVKAWQMLAGINMWDNPFVHADMQDAVESLRRILARIDGEEA